MSTPNQPNEQENAVMLISYKTLRTIVGVLGMFLAIILAIGLWILAGNGFQSSVSHFYHTRMGDVFVGLLAAISMFLFVYKGPERPDHWLGNLAGILGLIVAFVPTVYHGDFPPGDKIMCDRAPFNDKEFTQYIHLGAAFIFLVVLSVFSLWLFPKTHPGQTVQRGTRKWWRNVVYYVCGTIMIICLASLVIVFIINWNTIENIHGSTIVFWFEAVALFFFGVSWLVKGEQIVLKDI